MVSSKISKLFRNKYNSKYIKMARVVYKCTNIFSRKHKKNNKQKIINYKTKRGNKHDTPHGNDWTRDSSKYSGISQGLVQ